MLQSDCCSLLLLDRMCLLCDTGQMECILPGSLLCMLLPDRYRFECRRYRHHRMRHLLQPDCCKPLSLGHMCQRCGTGQMECILPGSLLCIHHPDRHPFQYRHCRHYRMRHSLQPDCCRLLLMGRMCLRCGTGQMECRLLDLLLCKHHPGRHRSCTFIAIITGCGVVIGELAIASSWVATVISTWIVVIAILFAAINVEARIWQSCAAAELACF